MEDITKGFKLPCVMDVKIGVQTWEPDAPESKILVERVSIIVLLIQNCSLRFVRVSVDISSECDFDLKSNRAAVESSHRRNHLSTLSVPDEISGSKNSLIRSGGRWKCRVNHHRYGYCRTW